MSEQHIAPDLTRHGVHIADGYGLQVHVHHRHLIVTDGYGDQRRRTRFHRATHGLKRLIVLGHTGYITLEAIRWLNDARIPLIQIDTDGTVLVSSRLGVNQPALRRAQAAAATNDTGIDLTRWLLHRKIDRQADVAERLDADTAAMIRARVDDLDDTDDLSRLRLVEAAAAADYWELWRPIPIRFATKHSKRVPRHWTTVGARRSPITGTSRRAANPIQAILNYLYALLEAEARIASLAVGLDPGVGILHTDQRDRDSLVLDLMEPIRPDVDAYVLNLLTERVFTADEFHETRRGETRILQPLTHQLAATTPTWAQRLAPIAEHITHTLSDGTAPTPLTQTNRGNRRNAPQPPPLPTSRCVDCGAPTVRRSHRCGTCTDETIRQPDHARLTRLSELRAAGADPAHGGAAAAKRGNTNRRHQHRVRDWDADNTRPSPEVFTEQILPLLSGISANALARATGLSAGYCSQIKNNHKVPHPRHWPSFQTAAANVDRP